MTKEKRTEVRFYSYSNWLRMTRAKQMSESPPIAKKGFSIDWLVKGSLTKIGDILDRLTGRGWKPSSTLATSELIERMKSMMDSEVRENGDKRKYVPHNIKLKMQWDKFSTDSPLALQKLENEFLIAAVDHINDKHYFTHAPLSIEVKPDYFTSGVKLFLSFDRLDADGKDAELEVTLENLNADGLVPETSASERNSGELRLSFVVGGKPVVRDIALHGGKRISVGRTKENDVAIDDQSISKAHASLLLNKEGKLIVADTGSTNGTFVRGERIAYGKAVELSAGESVSFGLVKVEVNFAPKLPAEAGPTQAYKIGDMEFASRTEAKGGGESFSDISDATQGPPKATQHGLSPPADAPLPTVASIPIKPDLLSPFAKPVESPVAPSPMLTETKIEVDKKDEV